MKRELMQRGLWLAFTAVLVAGLLRLDQVRGGPASTLSRCNLSLSRSHEPPADILIVGSSRTGTALDPVAMQQMLRHSAEGAPTVDRIALGHNPARASLGLLDNYLERRGTPRVLVLELMFQTDRTVDRLGQRGLAISPEQYIFRRDLNLLRFSQIMTLPAVAMPASESEGVINRWRFRLRGVVLRAGALVYEFVRHPLGTWSVQACDRDDWTREPEWPAGFAFGYGEADAYAPPAKIIETMEARMSAAASDKALAPWQRESEVGEYPYDFSAPYREGEMALLRATVELAASRNVPVVLLPLPLYGYTLDSDELGALADELPGRPEVIDLYGRVRVDLDKFWYDDGHIEPYPAGMLTTAILAQHLLERGSVPPVSRHGSRL
jgi:hypothetical protein